jgi:site-specific recombinase XerD
MNNLAKNNMIGLDNVQILDHIKSYFNELNRTNRDYEEKNTNSTQRAYEGDIRLYYNLIKNKEKGSELEYLSYEDLRITQENFEEFIEILCNLKKEDGKNQYVNKTINRKIISLKSFIRYIKRKKVISDFDISYLELIKGEKVRENHYDALEPEEVMEMSKLALKERAKGDTKSTLIIFAYKTGLRVSEAINLTWDNIITKLDEIYVKGIGKGNEEFNIRITKEMYQELLKLNKGQNKIFDISERRVTDMIDRMREKMDFGGRYIVFHSIRKAFGTTIWRMTGDIEAARRALRHKNVTTTQIYLGIGNYEVNDIIIAMEIDQELYKKATQEQLIEIINECPKSVQLVLNMKLQEILNKTN